MANNSVAVVSWLTRLVPWKLAPPAQVVVVLVVVAVAAAVAVVTAAAVAAAVVAVTAAAAVVVVTAVAVAATNLTTEVRFDKKDLRILFFRPNFRDSGHSWPEKLFLVYPMLAWTPG